MKKIGYFIMVITILTLSLSFTKINALAIKTDNKKCVTIWYQSLSNKNSISIEVPNGTKDLPSYALTALFDKKGLTNDQWSEIPDRTKLNSLSINDGVAIIDLNQEFIDGLTPNHNISLILDSIKKTIFQFDEIKAFKITIEGKEYKEVNGSYLSMLINKEINIILPNNTIPYGPVDPPPAPVIYLDAGHGGSESGAISNDGTTYEKDINLAIALKVRDYLVNNKGATVIMSRTSDITKDMNTRIAECNNNSSINFIVTIHCNGSTNINARGTESFYPSTHDVSTSSYLATDIHNKLLSIFPQFGPVTTHDGIGLLYYTHKPAALVEIGFMTNDTDLNLLKNNQTSIALQIYYGIRQWWWGN